MFFRKISYLGWCETVPVSGTQALCVSALFCLLAVSKLEAQPWKLVCFERDALFKTLDKVVNAQQFLRNDRLLKSGSCDFAQVPSNSSARFSGFHESVNGFIYPVFQVQYATTGQRMYAADGVFFASQWSISIRWKTCRNSGFDEICLVPRSCETLDGFVSTGRIPSYIAIPSYCENFRTR